MGPVALASLSPPPTPRLSLSAQSTGPSRPLTDRYSSSPATAAPRLPATLRRSDLATSFCIPSLHTHPASAEFLADANAPVCAALEAHSATVHVRNPKLTKNPIVSLLTTRDRFEAENGS
ncbi:hypothetical protein DV735_g1670, partial [Chaetothyriales sp. CBS 134920]